MKKLLRISSLILVFALLFSHSVLATGEPEDPGICAVVVNDPNVTFVALDANGAAVAAVEDPDIGTYYPNAVQFRVTLANQSNGAFRFLRVQDVAGVFQEQNLVYIDQVTVAGGNAVYEHVYPSELKKGGFDGYLTGEVGKSDLDMSWDDYYAKCEDSSCTPPITSIRLPNIPKISESGVSLKSPITIAF